MVSSYTCLIQALLTQSNDQTAAGLSFQVADVFVPELLAVLEEGGRGAGEATLRQLLDVFVEALATCSRGSLLPRIRCRLPGIFSRGGGLGVKQEVSLLSGAGYQLMGSVVMRGAGSGVEGVCNGACDLQQGVPVSQDKVPTLKSANRSGL